MMQVLRRMGGVLLVMTIEYRIRSYVSLHLLRKEDSELNWLQWHEVSMIAAKSLLIGAYYVMKWGK